MQEGSFWREQNAWWKQTATKMVAGQASESDWAQAMTRLGDLVPHVHIAAGIKKHDRQDLIQAVLLKLQAESVCQRLAEVDTPAHYLAKVMENLLLDEIADDAKLRKLFERYAKECETTEDERPEAQAIRNEKRALVRYLVNHEVDRRDRIALGGWLKGNSIAQIAKELKCTKTQASVILNRAKQAFGKLFRKKYGD